MNRIFQFVIIIYTFVFSQNFAYSEELFIIIPESRLIDTEKRLEIMLATTKQIQRNLGSIKNRNDKIIVAGVLKTLSAEINSIVKNIDDLHNLISSFYSTKNELKQNQAATVAYRLQNTLSDVGAIIDLSKKITKMAADQSTEEKSILSKYIASTLDNENTKQQQTDSYENVMKFFNALEQHLI